MPNTTRTEIAEFRNAEIDELAAQIEALHASGEMDDHAIAHLAERCDLVDALDVAIANAAAMTTDITAQIETTVARLSEQLGCTEYVNAFGGDLATRVERLMWTARDRDARDLERTLSAVLRALRFTSALEAEKCTVYISSEFGGTICRVECRSLKVERGPYAQHKSAVHVTFMEKGKRKLRGVVHHSPFILVLEGHGHPMPASMWTKPDANGVSESRHSMCSTNWHTEFTAMIDVHISETGARVLLDERKGIGA